jgi:hypothetical protein
MLYKHLLHYAAADNGKVVLFGFMTTLNHYKLTLNVILMMVKMTRKIYWSLLASTVTSAAVADYPLYDTELGRLSAGLTVQTATFGEVNNLSGSPDNANLSNGFVDVTAEPRLDATVNLPSNSTLYGGFSYVYSGTSGHDPSGYSEKNIDMYFQESDYTQLGRYANYRDTSMTENLYAGWKSGDVLNRLGKDALDISGGRQDYKLGSGFLIHYGADNGGNRGAGWMNPRTAFNNTVIAKVNVKDLTAEGFHLETRPLNPAEKRNYDGANMEYKITKDAKVGVSYINTTNNRPLHDEGSTINYGESSTNNDTYNARADFSPHPDVTVSAEYAYQTNANTTTTLEAKDKTGVHASGGFGQIEYKRQDLFWQPAISYRYAIQQQGFDSMSPGFSTWSTWFQGEINGEFVLYNSNLMTHVGRLILTPNESLALNLVYLNYTFVKPEILALTSADYGNEVNLLADWQVNDILGLSAGIEAFVPDEAGKQYLGGNKMWLQGMAAATLEF